MSLWEEAAASLGAQAAGGGAGDAPDATRAAGGAAGEQPAAAAGKSGGCGAGDGGAGRWGWCGAWKRGGGGCGHPELAQTTPAAAAAGGPVGKPAGEGAAGLHGFAGCGGARGRPAGEPQAPRADAAATGDRTKERKTYARCQACVKGALASESHRHATGDTCAGFGCKRAREGCGGEDACGRRWACGGGGGFGGGRGVGFGPWGLRAGGSGGACSAQGLSEPTALSFGLGLIEPTALSFGLGLGLGLGHALGSGGAAAEGARAARGARDWEGEAEAALSAMGELLPGLQVGCGLGCGLAWWDVSSVPACAAGFACSLVRATVGGACCSTATRAAHKHSCMFPARSITPCCEGMPCLFGAGPLPGRSADGGFRWRPRRALRPALRRHPSAPRGRAPCARQADPPGPAHADARGWARRQRAGFGAGGWSDGRGRAER
jgi:hypothetical protein